MRDRLASATDDVAFLEETLDYMYRTTRTIMHNAQPVDFAARGLLPPLQQRLEVLAHSTAAPEVTLLADEYDEVYPAPVKEELFWIIQAALANSREHAGATTVTVQLRKTETHVSVVVEDDGAGFDVDQALAANRDGKRRRLGLRNMKLRAERIGGELSIESGPAGTRVKVKVPTRIKIVPCVKCPVNVELSQARIPHRCSCRLSHGSASGLTQVARNYRQSRVIRRGGGALEWYVVAVRVEG